MAAAGYDIASGDTWALNEFSSAVRRGDGAARANARDFVRGLYEADGTLPQARGVAFTTGVSQRTPDLSTYKANLQGWLQDAAFWNDMSAYVSDFSAGELCGHPQLRSRRCAPPHPARPPNDYLQHQLRLPVTGPDTAAAARGYLQAAVQPALQCGVAMGFRLRLDDDAGRPDAGFRLRADLRAALRRRGSRRRGITASGSRGPRNALGLSASEFTAQTAALLDRLAAAVRDSGLPVVPGDSGVGACGPAGPEPLVRSRAGRGERERCVERVQRLGAAACGVRVPRRRRSSPGLFRADRGCNSGSAGLRRRRRMR